MNDIFAKIPSRNDQGIYKILSDERLFEPFAINDIHQIPYTPTYKLDDEEWFVISKFSTRDFSIDILKDGIISIDYNQLQTNDFEKIHFIFSVQSGDFYFQKTTPGKIIRKASFIEFGETARIQKIANSFHVSHYPDAVYFKEKDFLALKSLERISSIFKGIDTLYREATNEETNEFLGNAFIVLRDGYGGDKVKKANRKRIAMVINLIKKKCNLKFQAKTT